MEKIKIFYDGVSLDFIKNEGRDLIDGVTTNPTLMKSEGIKNFETFSRNLIQIIPDKAVSLEVFSDDLVEMRDQAIKINSWGSNVYIKIPISNSEGTSTKSLIRELLDEGLKLNVTAIFTLDQVKSISECFDGYDSNILSIFAGRIADTGIDPVNIIKNISNHLSANNLNLDLLWASSREVFNVVQANESGCNIITLNEELVKKLKYFNKNLLVYSLETVKMFKNDAEKAGYKI